MTTCTSRRPGTSRAAATLALALALGAAPLPARAATPPALPPPQVRAWQLGLDRPDRLQHVGFAYTSGLMVGLTSEEPIAAASSAMTLGLIKEVCDWRSGRGFDLLDLFADAIGAAGAAFTTITVTR